MSKGDQSQISQGPDFYANVPPAYLEAHTDDFLQKTDKLVRSLKDKIAVAEEHDQTWVHHASDIILKKRN